MGRRPSDKIIPVDFDPKKVGEQIALLRKAAGLTQLQLAEKIGVSRSSIADYERGENRIYDEMLVRLAIALDKTPNDLLFFEQNNSDNTQPRLRLMKRMLQIEQLPKDKQKIIIRMLDTLIFGAEQKNKGDQ
jgi:transcriptional regulator with XRE-family HTH domain